MGIQQKIILPYALLVIVAVLVAGLVSADFAERATDAKRAVEEKERSMRREMQRVQAILTSPVPKTDDMLKRSRPLFDGQIVVTDKDNAPDIKTLSKEDLLSFTRFLKPPADSASPVIARRTVSGRDYYIVADRRTDEQGCIYLIFSAERLDTGAPGPATTVLAVGAASLVLVLGVGFILARTITRRIRNLASLTTDISEGRFDRPVPESGRDEIGRLAVAFNRMQRGLQKYRDKLLSVEKMAALGQVSAAIAHEVRNPLNSIAMNVQAMENDDALDRRALEIIRGEVERLKVVIEDMLDIARVPHSNPAPADLKEICESMLRLMEKRLEHLHIRLVRDYAEDLPQIQVDTNRLRQVIMNLALNAADSMPEGGTLTVTTLLENGRAVCLIADTGRGIAPEHREKVFDMTFTTRPGGTGLGLAICRRIIEEHGGGIDFETGTEGTTFRFDLPVMQQAGEN